MGKAAARTGASCAAPALSGRALALLASTMTLILSGRRCRRKAGRRWRASCANGQSGRGAGRRSPQGSLLVAVPIKAAATATAGRRPAAAQAAAILPETAAAQAAAIPPAAAAAAALLQTAAAAWRSVWRLSRGARVRAPAGSASTPPTARRAFSKKSGEAGAAGGGQPGWPHASVQPAHYCCACLFHLPASEHALMARIGLTSLTSILPPHPAWAAAT